MLSNLSSLVRRRTAIVNYASFNPMRVTGIFNLKHRANIAVLFDPSRPCKVSHK